MRKMKFSDYKLIHGLSYNEMCRWARKFYDIAHQDGIDGAVNNGVVKAGCPNTSQRR